MPEEKKDSFTFSDKIKSSKPAASKSFGNRISSKIGSNGKPKKTLFERSKRDAPFFIAAMIALLLLPFLYKYSGQVNEELIATPGSEESVFDPDRNGFGTVTTDPDGQIAQLAGRDSLSLIKWGSPAEAVSDSNEAPLHDGVGDSYAPPTTESNTNIYKTTAPAATRGAMKRAATKIKELGGAGMTSRGGGQLAVGPWGGGLKKAAAQVGGIGGPRQGPKPVSLQPLQAAGKSSRSYFGQGAAAEARRSKDALSKGNAMQALRDAQMRPVAPGKIGGLTGTDYRGGGNGDLKHAFAFNGIKPWWWDLMSQKHMHDWMWKRDLWQKPITTIVEEIGKGLANFLGQALGCIITGNSDWDPGTLAGAPEGSIKEAKCGELTEEDWKKCEECKKYGPFGKRPCKAYLSTLTPGSSMVKKGWDGGNKSEGNFGPITVRLNCLSKNWGNKGKARGVEEDSGCGKFATDGRYQVSFETNRAGGMNGWSVFHYVVGVSTTDAAQYFSSAETQRQKLLTVFYMNKGASFNLTDAQYVKESEGYVPLFVEAISLKKEVATENSSDTARLTFFGKENKGQVAFPMPYSAFKDTFAKGTNLLALAGKNDAPKYGKAGGQGKDWAIGGRCPMPLATIRCQDNALLETFPYAEVQVSGTVGSLEPIKTDFSVYYTIENNGSYSPVQSGRTGAKEIAMYPAELGGTGKVSPSNKMSYQVKAQNGVTPPIETKMGDQNGGVFIRWSIRQGKDINWGKENPGTSFAGDRALGTAKPGIEVSVAYCKYYNEGGSVDSVEPPTVDPNEEENLPNKPVQPDEVPTGKTSFATELTKVPVDIYDRPAQKGNQPLVFASKGALVKQCNTGGQASFYFNGYRAYSQSAQDFVIKIAQLYNQKVKEMKSGAPEISYSDKYPKLPAFLDALYIAQQLDPDMKVEKSAVCSFAKAIGVGSIDTSVTGKQCFNQKGSPRVCHNVFGAYASYISPDSSFYPARLLHSSLATQEKKCNPRFTGVNEIRGKEGIICKKNVDPKYHYGRYNWDGDRSKFLQYMSNKRGYNQPEDYPLAELAVAGIQLDPGRTYKADQNNRKAYWAAYYERLLGSCNIEGEMSIGKVIKYTQDVCKNGFSAKPDNGWNGQGEGNPADPLSIQGLHSPSDSDAEGDEK